MLYLNQFAAGILTIIASGGCAAFLFLSSFSALLKGLGLLALLCTVVIMLLKLGHWRPQNNVILYSSVMLGGVFTFFGYATLTVPSLRKVAAMPFSLIRIQCAIDSTSYPSLPSNAALLVAYKKLMLFDSIDHLMPTNQVATKPLKHAQLLNREFYFYDYDNVLLLLHEIFAAKNYAFKTANPAPHIIDCGSNVGVSIVFFKILYPQASVIGFEAGPDAFAALTKTVQANHLEHVTVYNKAVFNRDGVLHIPASHLSAGNPSGSVLTSSAEATATVAIPCVKLSDYIDREVDMLKIDVEGAESEVFEDLAKNNKLRHIKQMIIEFHNMAKDQTRPSLASFLQLLDAHNFVYIIHSPIRTPFNITDDYPILVYATRK